MSDVEARFQILGGATIELSEQKANSQPARQKPHTFRHSSSPGKMTHRQLGDLWWVLVWMGMGPSAADSEKKVDLIGPGERWVSERMALKPSRTLS